MLANQGPWLTQQQPVSLLERANDHSAELALRDAINLKDFDPTL